MTDEASCSTVPPLLLVPQVRIGVPDGGVPRGAAPSVRGGKPGSSGWRGGFQQPTVSRPLPGSCSMTAVVSSAPMATRSLDPRAIGMIEAVVIPVGALVASAVLFSIFLLLLGKSPLTFFNLVWTRRLRLGLLHPEHAAARGAADPDRPRLRHSRPHRPDADRRGRGARARRLRGGRDRHPAGHGRLAGVHRPAAHGDRGDAGRRPLDRARRLAAALSRRQRNDLVAAAVLHRHRHHELLRRGRAARSGVGQQAVDHADRRCLPRRHDPRHRRCIGVSPPGSCWRSRSTC